MNYEAIKTEIEALIKEANQTPHGRVETVLEPLRETLIEARRQGVKLRALFTKLEEAGVAISPSSFAKYSQKYLQVKKTKGKGRSEQAEITQGIPPVKHKKTKAEEPNQTTKTTTGKARIATGNY